MLRHKSESHSVGCLLPAVFLLLAACCPPPAAFAQSATATLSGAVLDEKGAVIAGVTVTIINNATSLKRQTTTGAEGSFTAALLPPGAYTVTFERDGFASVKIPEVVLNVGDQRAIQIQLKVGRVDETVTVQADSSIQESAAVATVVDRQFVENLPLNGRSFQSLINLTPGVVTTPTSFAQQGQFSVNGQRPDTNYFTVDGVSANAGVAAGTPLVQTASGALPATSALGGTNNLVSVDALQEFRIQTSTFAPEFGRTPGAQVQILTRSGTNGFRGNVFDYFRNDLLDAKDWFANSRGLAKPALRQNDFGGVLGGPIIKNKTFFFFSYEGLRLRQPVVGIGTVPSLQTRRDAAAVVRPLLNAFPLPNGRDFGNGLAEFSASFSNPSSLNATSIRVDHSLGAKLTLFGRYNHAPSDTTARGSTGFTLSTLVPRQVGTDTLTLGDTWVISPTNSNEFRFNYSRTQGKSSIVLDNFGGAAAPPDSLFFPSPFSSKDAIGFVVILNQATLGVGKNVVNVQRQINLVDNHSIVHGAHAVKFGVDYRRLAPSFGPRNYDQTAQFSDLNAITTGRAVSVFIGANGNVDLFYTNFSAFGQDTWKINQRLTLTYGLRWDVNPPPAGQKGLEPFAVTGFNNFPTLALAPRGTPLWETTYDNFAPRFGVAYQLSNASGRETVLRGGAGIFYDLGTSATGLLAGTGTFPYGGTKTLNNVDGVPGVPFPLTAAQAAPPPILAVPPVGTIRVFDPQLKLPRVYQWNLAVEQSLGSSRSLSASYVAAVGRRLIHQRTVSSNSTLNPTFTGSTSLFSNGDTSDYHALQVQFKQRLVRRLQALASYTWAHAIDNASADNPLFDSGNRGPSGLDIRHAFNAAVTYNLPTPEWGPVAKAVLGSWSVDTIISARTAFPVNITALSGTDPATGQPYSVRADLIAGVPLYVDDPSVAGGRRINRAAFSVPPLGANGIPIRQGTLGRNALRSFPVRQIDLALRREFKLTERVKLQFRSEFFNLFNHPNFGPPVTNLNSPLFGQSTSTLGNSLGSTSGAGGGFSPLYQIGGPRSMQLALRLSF